MPVILPPDSTGPVPGHNQVTLPAQEVTQAPPSDGFQAMMGYNYLLNQQAAEVDRYGVPVTVAAPKVRTMEGYEDELNKKKENYEFSVVKAFIDFNPKRGVFYKFNWVPEDADELVAVVFHPSMAVFADVFIRTTAVGNPSPYGDVLLKVVKVFDTGKYQVLNRTCFCKVMSDEQLWRMLFPEERRE